MAFMFLGTMVTCSSPASPPVSAATSASRVAVEGLASDRPRPDRLLPLLAVAAGASVANIYYAQPLLVPIARAFDVGAGTVGWIPTLTQAGYGAGMLLVVPFGDRLERRGLMVRSAFAAALVLAVTAVAPGFPALALASFLLGLASVLPQLAVPYAAALAPEGQRGRYVGVVMSGLLAGILLSRTVSGLIGAHGSFRLVYALAAVVMVALGVVLRVALPAQSPERVVPVRELFGSLATLVRREPVLRRHALLGAAGFGAFSAFWSTLAFFLATPPLHYGADVAGAFGVLGVLAAFVAPLAGRLADARGPRFVNRGGLVLCLAACALMGSVAARWPALALPTIAVGVLLLDVGVQSSHIANQARIFAMAPALRNRLNTIYMTAYFGGGALGSSLGAAAWARAGLPGAMAVGAAFALAGLAAVIRSPSSRTPA